MNQEFRYAAFISYSSRDSAFVVRFHRALESYRIPKTLGRIISPGGSGKRNRIFPVFRDRDNLSAGELESPIKSALESSSALIVVCSPATVQSKWVGDELTHFVGLGRPDRVFAVIPEDAPLEIDGRDATPVWLRSVFPPGPAPDTAPNILAADARKSKDGFHMAVLKCVAGVAGVPLGKLIDRDRAARRRRRTILACVALLIAGLTVALIAALRQQSQRTSDTLAELSATAAREGQYDGATRFALAGMNGFDTPIIGFNPAAAQAQLLQTAAELFPANGDSAFFRKGGKELVFSAGVRIYIKDLESGAQRWMNGGHDYGGKILFLAPDETTLVTFGTQGEGTCLFDLDSGKVLSSGPQAREVAGMGGADGKQLLIAVPPSASQGPTGIYNLTTKQWVVQTPSGIRAISPNGKKAVGVYTDREFQLFDLSSPGQPQIVKNAADSNMDVVVFSPDGKYIVVGGQEDTGETSTGCYAAWNVETLQPVWPKDAHGNPFIGTSRWGPVQYSPDGTMLALFTGDRIVIIDPATGATRKTLTPDLMGAKPMDFYSGASPLAFSPDSRLLAFGLADKTIRLWDLQRNVEMARFRGHYNLPARVQFDPSGRKLLSIGKSDGPGDEGGEVKLWSIDAALNLRGQELMDRARTVTLADYPKGERRAVFTPEELSRASMLDPTLHADVSNPPSLFRTLLALRRARRAGR